MPKELEKLRDWEKEFDEKYHYQNGVELLLSSPNHFQTYDVTNGIKNFIREKFQERDKLLVERAGQWRDYFDDVKVDAEVLEEYITKEKPEWLGMIQGIKSVAGMAKHSVESFIKKTWEV